MNTMRYLEKGPIMGHSLKERIVHTHEPFVFFHTHSATREAIEQAVASGKSMDLDISLDAEDKPYLGHSLEYHRINGETKPETMPFEAAIDLISSSTIPVIIDCKQSDAWRAVEAIVRRIGASRVLLHSFASELKFDYEYPDHDYPSEWSPIARLAEIKEQFPEITTTASCKFLPGNFLTNPEYEPVLSKIRDTLKNNRVDTVCLNVPDSTMSDEILVYFLSYGIIPHVGVDKIDTARLTKLYIGETDILESASDASKLEY